MRQVYAQINKIEVKYFDYDWTQGFQIYHEFQQIMLVIEQDGGAFKSQRKIPLEAKMIRDLIFSEDSSTDKSLSLINTYCCINFDPYFEFQEHTSIHPVFTDDFIRSIKLFKNDEKKLKSLCHYMLKLSRGQNFKKLAFGDKTNQTFMYENKVCLFSSTQYACIARNTLIFAHVLPKRILKCDDEDKLVRQKTEMIILVSEVLNYDCDKLKMFCKEPRDHPLSEYTIEGNIRNYYLPFKYNLLREQEPSMFMRQINIAKQFYMSKMRFSYDIFGSDCPIQGRQKKPINYVFKEDEQKGPLYFLSKSMIKYELSEYKFNQQERKWQPITEDKSKLSKYIDGYQHKYWPLQSIQKENETNKIVSVSQQKKEEIIEFIKPQNYTMNGEQYKIIYGESNLICQGRSGTGKTTATIIRMFSDEITKHLVRKTKLGLKGSLTQDDLNRPTGLKYVFVTASPVLSNEVKSYYSSLKKSLLYKIQNVKKKTDDTIESMTAEDFEKQELLQFIKEQEDQNVSDGNEAAKKANIPSSISQLQSEHFPFFSTIKQLFYMIDGSLDDPFFKRDKDKNIIGLDKQTSWHSEGQGGMMMINESYKREFDFSEQMTKFSDEILELDDKKVEQKVQQVSQVVIKKPEDYSNMWGQQKMMAIRKEEKLKKQEEEKKAKEEKMKNKQKPKNIPKPILEKIVKTKEDDGKICFEITFELFESRFYNKLQLQKKYKKISANTVWSEIYSVIKGSIIESQYSGVDSFFPLDRLKIMDIKQYVATKNVFLNIDEKYLIYYAYLKYEKWKRKVCAYDFMDLVQHIQKNSTIVEVFDPIDYKWYDMKSKHYSDNRPRLCRSKRRYIARINLRVDYLIVDEVQDLPQRAVEVLLNLSNNRVYFAGDTAQTIAQGMGSRLGDLGDMIKQLKEGYTIDNVYMRTNYRSTNEILNVANSIVQVIQRLFPKSIDKQMKENSIKHGTKPIFLSKFTEEQLLTFFTGANINHNNGKKIEFGCSQVVIVRKQEDKKNLPPVFENMLTLTVYESKGLEFNDVIIYNFFEASEASDTQWDLLGELIVIKKEFDIKQDGTYYRRNLQEKIYLLYSMLCAELKFLYVAVTRAKQRVVFFDKNQRILQSIVKLWQDLDFVHIVTGSMIDEPSKMPDEIKQIAQNGMNSEQNSADEWKIQGIKLMKKKYYDQAIKCFKFSGENNLVYRCQAFQMANNAEKLINEANSIQWKIKNSLEKPTKQQLREMKKQIQTKRKDAKNLFDQAGDSFQQCNLLNHAGSCYFTAFSYRKAAEIFQKMNLFAQAAECFMRMKNFSQAGKMFIQANNIHLATKCLELAGDWEDLLNLLSKNKDKFEQEQLQQLVNLYIPVALNKIYQNLSDQSKEANYGTIQEMKIKMKYQKEIEQILEVDEYGEEIQDSEEEEEKPDKEEKQVNEEEEIQESFEIEEVESEIPDDDEALNLTRELQMYRQESQSFEIEQSNNETITQDDFEILSNYDPDDEFLQSERSFSIIDSIKSGGVKSIDSNSIFSAITQRSIVRDTRTEDIITQKIIYYVSLFSEEVKTSLDQLRSQGKLTDIKNIENGQQVDEFMIRLDDIDIDFIELVINMLEYYNLNKLVIILCNRYKLTDRISKSIQKIASKYSNLQNVKFKIGENIQNNQRLQSLISYEAIQNALNLIDEQYLEQDNGTMLLETDTFHYMLTNGYWKKLVGLLKPKEALEICYIFFNEQQFQIIKEKYGSDSQAEEKMKLRAKCFSGQSLDGHQAMIQQAFMNDMSQINIGNQRLYFNEVFRAVQAILNISNQPEYLQIVYNCFMISDISNCQVFGELKERFVLMSRKSVLFDEVVHFYKNLENLKKINTIHQRCFQNQDMIKTFLDRKEQIGNLFYDLHSYIDRAFFIDIECEFVMVPKDHLLGLISKILIEFLNRLRIKIFEEIQDEGQKSIKIVDENYTLARKIKIVAERAQFLFKDAQLMFDRVDETLQNYAERLPAVNIKYLKNTLSFTRFTKLDLVYAQKIGLIETDGDLMQFHLGSCCENQSGISVNMAIEVGFQIIDFSDFQSLLQGFRIFMQGRCLEVFEEKWQKNKKLKKFRLLFEFNKTFNLGQYHKCAELMLEITKEFWDELSWNQQIRAVEQCILLELSCSNQELFYHENLAIFSNIYSKDEITAISEKAQIQLGLEQNDFDDEVDDEFLENMHFNLIKKQSSIKQGLFDAIDVKLKANNQKLDQQVIERSLEHISQVLQKQDQSKIYQRAAYSMIYNILIGVIGNIKDLSQNVQDKINGIIVQMLESPYGDQLQQLYLLEQGTLTSGQFHEIYEEFQATIDKEKATFFHINASKTGYITVKTLKQEFQLEPQKNPIKISASHYSLSYCIKKVMKNREKKIKDEMKFDMIQYARQKILDHAIITYPLDVEAISRIKQKSEKEIDKFLYFFEPSQEVDEKVEQFRKEKIILKWQNIIKS